MIVTITLKRINKKTNNVKDLEIKSSNHNTIDGCYGTALEIVKQIQKVKGFDWLNLLIPDLTYYIASGEKKSIFEIFKKESNSSVYLLGISIV